MGFINSPVDPDLLPDAASLAFDPMAPAYPREVRTQHLITWLVIVVALAIPAVIVARPEGLRLALIGLPGLGVLLGALFTWLAVKSARVKGIALRDHDMAFRSGLIFRKIVLLPFNRVQHVEISSGPLQRKFGLASLKFYTAGGAGIDLKIDGLLEAEANRLREFIMDKAGRDF